MNCKNCGKELIGRQIKYCCIKCQTDYKYNNYISDWKNGKENGIRGNLVSRHIIRYLFEINDNKCQTCGWSKTNTYTNKIPLEVHHKDGNYKNNLPENLELICPNCHSLTSSYKRRGKGRTNRT